MKNNKLLQSFIVALTILSLELSASCVYVPCSPSVEMNTVLITQQYETKFKQMGELLSTVEKDYKDQSLLLKSYNEKLKIYETLKKEYLLVLQEIAYQKRELLMLKDPHAVK